MSAPRPLSSLGDLYSWLSRGRRGPVTPRGSPSTSTSRPGRQQPPGTPLCGSNQTSCHPSRARQRARVSLHPNEGRSTDRSMILWDDTREIPRDPISIRESIVVNHCRRMLASRNLRADNRDAKGFDVYLTSKIIIVNSNIGITRGITSAFLLQSSETFSKCRVGLCAAH